MYFYFIFNSIGQLNIHYQQRVHQAWYVAPFLTLILNILNISRK